jgi:hypothetical protein
MINILSKSVKSKNFAKRAFSCFAQAHSHSHHDYPELQQSYMKIVGGDVDTLSSDYQENYQKMQALNRDLDDIVSKTLDVG